MDLQSLLAQVIQWHKDSQYEPVVQMVSLLSLNYTLLYQQIEP